MKKILLSAIIILNMNFLFSQEKDTLNINQPDTLITSSRDSLLTQDTTKTYAVDTTIYASSSDSLIFYVNKKKMNLYGESKLDYKTTHLKSANIFVDFETNYLEAEGVKSDSVPGKYVNTPVLEEDGEVYEGFSMRYNFKNKQGFISSAGTEQEGARYTGAKIKKVTEDTYFIEDGIYTTCDLDDPHYFFYANKMKIIHKQQVVARWIWLNFGDVPFPVPIPFAVFPLESGRRSGILPPAFGQDATYGFYFSRFGYFWAISDYMDLNLTGDYYTRGSFAFDSRFRYVERYNFNGNLQGGYSKRIQGETTDSDRSENTDWRLKWDHNQTITPTLKFNAHLEFTSGNYVRRNVADFNELLRNEITSNATLFKSWDESGNSLSLSYKRRQDLESGDISEVLPNLTFNKTQSYPFRREGKVGEQKWYELFGYSYSGQFQNNRNKTSGNLRIRGGIQHNVNTSFSPKIGYFSLTPSFRYNEKWYNKKIDRKYVLKTSSENPDSTYYELVTDDVKEINLVRTFSAGLTTQTKFYGMFSPGVLGIKAIRHTVNPSISYNYTPDFSKPFWGYYDSYVDTSGKVVRYDKFGREVFGGVPGGESQSVSFSLGNIFEMKTEPDPNDTTSQEQKIQLLNLNASLSYNFAADSLRFSNLNLNYRTQIGEWFSLSGSSIFSLYENIAGRTINKFLINEGKGLLRLTNFNFSISTNLSGDKLRSKEGEEDELTQTAQEEQYVLGNSQDVYRGIYEDKDPDFTIPWDIALTYNYNMNKNNPARPTFTSNISGGFNFNLTPNWKFSFTGSYDFINHEFAAPQIKVSRDLHCWIMNFTWNPIGTFRGYRFEIRVKAPQLQDLKITKRDQFYSGK